MGKQKLGNYFNQLSIMLNKYPLFKTYNNISITTMGEMKYHSSEGKVLRWMEKWKQNQLPANEMYLY